MNILFVNYGDFTTNSLNHISGFANSLAAAGHACMVVVPDAKETISHLQEPLFIPATYAEALGNLKLFPDAKPADLIHAWTPREGVRKFVIAYQRLIERPAHLVIHLEDNERFLLEAYTGMEFSEVRSAQGGETAKWLVDGLSHPLRHETFLGVADAVTYITDRLAEFVSTGTPSQLLVPGVDFALYHPQQANRQLREQIGLAENEKVLVFTGSNTFANEPEMRELYLAVSLLNTWGIPTRLVRTGFNSPKFLSGLSDDVKRHVIDLGFVEKRMLPSLLALADVLVQPGRADAFNNFRLPSKLPEFLAMGKPVVLPASNLALLMSDGKEGVFLSSGKPDEIATICSELFSDPKRCEALGKQAVAFARAYFDIGKNTDELLSFYNQTQSRTHAADWSLLRNPGATDVTLIADKHRRALRGGQNPGNGWEMLSLVVRELEESVEWNSRLRHEASVDRDAIFAREQLTRQHAANVQNSLDAALTTVANLEHRLSTTQVHADNLGKALEATTRHASNLEDSLNATRNHSANLERALEATRDEKAQAEKTTAATQNHVANIEKTLEATRDENAQAEKTITATQNHAANIEKALEATRDEKAQAEKSIAATQNHVANIEKALEAIRVEKINTEIILGNTRDHVSNLETSLAETRIHANNVEQALVATCSEKSEIEKILAAARNHADNLAEQLAGSLQREKGVTESRSWRMTAPLRSLRRALAYRPVDAATTAAAEPAAQQDISKPPSPIPPK